jgi:acyl carrier protein
MNSDVVRKAVRQFIQERFMIGMSFNGVLDADSLLEKGIIDSTGVLELVGFLEESFGMKIEDEELVPENLETVNNIVSFVTQKTGAGA